MADEQSLPPDLSHLSPAMVLNQQAPSVPPPLPTRDELLRQASEAPDTQLILPADVVETRPATPVAIQQEVPLPPPPLPPPPTEPQLPQLITQVRSTPRPERDPDIELIRPHRLVSSGRKRIGRIIAEGIAGLLVLGGIAATLYVLVQRGVRVPILYPRISNLATNGLSERDQAVAYLSAQHSYQFAPDSKISFKLLSGGSTSLGSGVNPTSAISTEVQTGQSVLPAETYSVKEGITGPGSVPVPLLYTLASPNMQLQLPLNAAFSNQAVPLADIHQSMLQAVLIPPTLTSLLKAATKETTYQQDTVAGQRVAVYSYSANSSLLSASFPEGATFKNATETVAYFWGSSQPASAQLSATLLYKGAQYTYAATLKYSQWNQPVTDTALSSLASHSSSPLTISDFIAQLGFPEGTLLGSSVSKPIPVSQPAASPTGQYTAALLPQITTQPPNPASSATAQAISNDAQRKADMILLQSALERYKTASGSYPKGNDLEQVQNSQSLLTALVPTYLTALPIDPTRTVFWYEYQSDGKTYTLRSVAENPEDVDARQGTAYHYFQYSNQ